MARRQFNRLIFTQNFVHSAMQLSTSMCLLSFSLLFKESKYMSVPDRNELLTYLIDVSVVQFVLVDMAHSNTV